MYLVYIVGTENILSIKRINLNNHGFINRRILWRISHMHLLNVSHMAFINKRPIGIIANMSNIVNLWPQ